MPGGLEDFWLDEELDVVLAVEADSDSSTTQQLSKLGHRVVLSKSPYLKAQVLRWQRKRPAQQQQPQQQPERTTRSRNQQQLIDQAANTPLPDEDRPQVVLTLQDAEQEPAARAVLASLYDKPLPELLSGLSQEEQLSAAVLADMWDVAAFSEAAADALAKAADSEEGLEGAVSKQLLGMQAYPHCLLSVVEAVLLTTYGDLEAVWRDAELQKQMWALPLSAFEALLASDKLKASSEDNVLYTAHRYVDSIQDAQQQQAASKRLGPLIRCPHLSLCWLSAALNPKTAHSLPLLQELNEHIWRLLMCRHADPSAALTTADAQKYLSAAPASWSLPPRPSVDVNRVEVSWSLPVSELRVAAAKAASTRRRQILVSSDYTPPLLGVMWQCGVELSPAPNGTVLGMFARSGNSPDEMFWKYYVSIRVHGVKRFDAKTGLQPAVPVGSRDFFDIGPMAGGWDEQKLVAKGVPVRGNLDITLRVTGVAHGL